jgi:alkylation response protein AidB-like acyl-CoA dehydrogenase
LDEALKYSQQRVAFGQPIANFQSIQFMLADMATEIDAARLLTRKAAWKQGTGALHDGSCHRQAVCQRDGNAGNAQSHSNPRRVRQQP